MPIPTIVAVGAVTSGTGALTITLPTGTIRNDILIAIINTANQNPSPNPATGWNIVSNPPVGFGGAGVAGGVKLHVWWRRAEDGEGSLTFADSGDMQIGRMIGIRGCRGGDPWTTSATSNVTTAATAVSWPDITTTIPNSLIIGALGGDRDIASTTDMSAVTNANLGSITDRMENWVIAGTGGGIYMFTGTKATTGAIGASTGTITSQTFSLWIGALAGNDPSLLPHAPPAQMAPLLCM
jgi:hypothetical protein